jgi:hypothetical protein
MRQERYSNFDPVSSRPTLWALTVKNGNEARVSQAGGNVRQDCQERFRLGLEGVRNGPESRWLWPLLERSEKKIAQHSKICLP